MARKDKINSFRKVARKLTRKRQIKRSQESIKVKEVSREFLCPGGEFNFILYLKEKSESPHELLRITQMLKDFIQSTITSKYKIHYSSNYWTKERWIASIKLEDETDLFTMMLCHSDCFRKILKLVDTKKPA